MTTSLKILIADDHEVVRHGIRSLLEAHPGWRVCAEATDGRDAVEKAKELMPDIVVMDIAMPGLNGLDAARQIRQELPKTEVLILTMHNSDQVAREVLRAGVRGYVLKSDGGRDLVQAVETLARHQPFLTARVQGMVLDEFLRLTPEGQRPPRAETLTAREREIVQLLAEGKGNKEVASVLNVSTKTVETHRANIMRKLRLQSLGDLIRYAIRNNLTEP